MTKEQIHTNLSVMLDNPKAKTFLNHLVRSYMPVDNVSKVVETPTKDFKCVLTKVALMSTDDIIKGIQSDELKATFIDSFKKMFDDKVDRTTPAAKLMGEKKLGVTGKETTTFMSYEAYQEFINWVITKSLQGDKHINWLLGSIRRETLMARAELIQDVDVQNKVDKFRRNTIKGTTISLGETSDVLSKLKASLLASGK